MSEQPAPALASTRRKLALIGVVVLLLAIAVAAYMWMSHSKSETTGIPITPGAQGGTYADLSAGQKRLVDDWTDRYSKVMGRKVSPAELYSDLALSTKTTLNAVTHALSQTKLTDKSGQSMNLTALDLVSRVETVAGRVPGKGGDKQFRVYFEMKPGARDLLTKSQEFSRQVDNTVFHKGYPTCFRGSGGTPSIQISLSRDEKHGDIDVDYRSSTFPIMLVNGHLTASNSDVRAGDNDQRHNGHWSGLKNWWRGFMGLPYVEITKADPAAGISPAASQPRLGKSVKPEEAIHDFLNAWLVEQNPGVAAGYISPRAFACLELERGIPIDRGLARFQLLRAMQSANQLLGKPASLGDVVSGVALTGPRGKVIEQPYHGQFVMYDVREDFAEQFDCENRLHPEGADPKKTRSTDFGNYIGAVFQVKTPAIKGEVIATVWAQEKTGWTLMSYDVEPELRPGAFSPAPLPPTGSSEPALPVISGDPAMKRTAKAFHDAWFMKKDAAAAFRYLAPSAFSCYNVFRPDTLPKAGSPEEGGRLIQERMKVLAEWTGTGTQLDDLLVAAEPHHHDLKLVQHAQEKAFALVSVPDSMGAAADCSTLAPGESPRFDQAGQSSHGRFYATGTKLKRAGPDAAVLWIVWARQGRDWKIVSYLVVTP